MCRLLLFRGVGKVEAGFILLSMDFPYISIFLLEIQAFAFVTPSIFFLFPRL